MVLELREAKTYRIASLEKLNKILLKFDRLYYSFLPNCITPLVAVEVAVLMNSIYDQI